MLGEQAGRVALDEHGRPRSFPEAWLSLQETVRGFGQVMSASQQPRWPWVDIMWHAIAGQGLPVQPLVCDWTFDVDVAFKHKGRSRLKSWLLQVRDFGLGRWATVQERFTVNRGWIQDPYDTYDWLLEHHRGEQVTFTCLPQTGTVPMTWAWIQPEPRCLNWWRPVGDQRCWCGGILDGAPWKTPTLPRQSRRV